jgi:hypothetical protein
MLMLAPHRLRLHLLVTALRECFAVVQFRFQVQRSGSDIDASEITARWRK